MSLYFSNVQLKHFKIQDLKNGQFGLWSMLDYVEHNVSFIRIFIFINVCHHYQNHAVVIVTIMKVLLKLNLKAMNQASGSMRVKTNQFCSTQPFTLMKLQLIRMWQQK